MTAVRLCPVSVLPLWSATRVFDFRTLDGVTTERFAREAHLPARSGRCFKLRPISVSWGKGSPLTEDGSPHTTPPRDGPRSGIRPQGMECTFWACLQGMPPGQIPPSMTPLWAPCPTCRQCVAKPPGSNHQEGSPSGSRKQASLSPKCFPTLAEGCGVSRHFRGTSVKHFKHVSTCFRTLAKGLQMSRDTSRRDFSETLQACVLPSVLDI